MTGEIKCETPQQGDQQERRSSVDNLTDFKPPEYFSSPLEEVQEAEAPNRHKRNSTQRSLVADVIEFEPLEDPPWRELGKDTEEKPREYPTVKQMIVDIVAFREISTTKEHGEEVLKKIRKKMIHKYIYQVGAEEEHGVGTLEKTIECIKVEEELKISQLKEEEERAPLTEEEQETTNVYRAYKWLEDKVKKECEEDESLYGLIESSIVKELHKIIMDKLSLEHGKTKPGKCSDLRRCTSFNGELYEYQNPNDMEEELNKLLDRFNSLIHWSKSISNGEERILKVFKAASWFLFEFLDLHPFSDGNGRLCRLLCSYVISVCSPFPTPIYNIWSESCKEDYTNALVDTRKSSDRHPKALATMIIECSWYTWKEYIKELEKIQMQAKTHVHLNA